MGGEPGSPQWAGCHHKGLYRRERLEGEDRRQRVRPPAKDTGAFRSRKRQETDLPLKVPEGPCCHLTGLVRLASDFRPPQQRDDACARSRRLSWHHRSRRRRPHSSRILLVLLWARAGSHTPPSNRLSRAVQVRCPHFTNEETEARSQGGALPTLSLVCDATNLPIPLLHVPDGQVSCAPRGWLSDAGLQFGNGM